MENSLPLSMWILGLKLRSSGFLAGVGALVNLAISPALGKHIYKLFICNYYNLKPSKLQSSDELEE